MAGKALPEGIKRIKQRHAENAQMQAAVNAYALEKTKPEKERKGLHRVAEAHGVDYTTLSRLYQGKRSMSAFHASCQKLTPEEEHVLVNASLESADQGFPPTRDRVVLMANAILEGREGSAYKQVGIHWIDRFLHRHHEELQWHWSKPLDTVRAQALNPETVKDWFNNVVKKFLVDLKIDPQDIYGMDETGCQPSAPGTQRVIGRRGTKRQHKQGGGDRENMTVIVTICADGTTLRPTIIFKGKNFMRKWGENNVANASICHSPNGWTDGELAAKWLVDDFDAQTKEKARGRTRVLFMDGHSSHYTPKLLPYAKDNKITVLGYPPHCTHALQGLDVVCFARLKEIYKEEVKNFEDLHHHKLTKLDFTAVFGAAFLRTFTPDSIKAAFSATGIHPFNPDVISPSRTKPSEPTSTKGVFPLLQPSPVQAVMAAYHHQRPTSFDTSPTTHMRVHRRRRSSSAASESPERDPNINPALYTPSKRIRLMASAISATSSGSFLVSQTPITSAHTIAAPVLEHPPQLPELDWSLLKSVDTQEWKSRAQLENQVQELTTSLRRACSHVLVHQGIVEAANAQLIIQNIHVGKLQESLQHKESKKKTERAKLFPSGKGRHLTAEEFIQELETADQARLDKVNKKRQRKETLTVKRAAKEVADREWKLICARHDAAVLAWERTCSELTAQKVLKKNLPKKPLRPPKPQPAPVASSSRPAEESDDDSTESELDA